MRWFWNIHYFQRTGSGVDGYVVGVCKHDGISPMARGPRVPCGTPTGISLRNFRSLDVQGTFCYNTTELLMR